MKKLLLALILFLSSCMTTKPEPQGFDEKLIQTEHFSIAVWEKQSIQSGKPLRLYIEGDGNPNPRHQIAKYYASNDPYKNVIYLSRPCQWTNDKICQTKPQIYRQERFHPEIINEMQELVEYLMRKHKATEVEFVGYDGGATIALLLATKVPTKRIITIAGIVDTDAYATHHGFVFPHTTVNPANLLAPLASIPQVHYIGQHDDETPRRMAERFVSKMHNPTSAAVKVVPDIAHSDWEGVRLDY